MTIKVTYNVTDVYMTQSVSPVYINVSYSDGGASGGGVWGSITGTLSNQTDLQTALDLKVPYTGATGNVDLGEYELKAGQVEFDQTPTGAAGVGVMRWNDADGTVDLGLKGGNVTLQVGQEQVARVVNKTGANLLESEYKVVKVSSAQGQRLAVDLAQANNDNNSADTLGIVTENIDNNQEGFITTLGTIRGINTTGSLQGETWTDGDVLYLSGTTAGAITNVKPTAPLHIVVVGYVEYAHVNNGKIYVKVMNGWELDELHNVSIITPTNNQGLFYNSSNSLWENKSISTVLGYTPEQPLTFNSPLTRAGNVVSIPQATGSVNGFLSATDWTTFNSKQAALGYTPANAATTLTINGVTYDLSTSRTWTIAAGISGSGAAGQVTYWTGASAVSGSNNLFWDNANGRLGIGSNTFYTPALGWWGGTDQEQKLFLKSTASTKFTSLVISGGATGSGGGAIQFLNFAGTPVADFGTADGSEIGFAARQNTANINFYTTPSGTSPTRRLSIFASGNVGIGGTLTSDPGTKFFVSGDTLLRGSGATSATTALTVQNSSGTNLFTVRNDGNVGIGIGASQSFPLDVVNTGTSATFNVTARFLQLSTQNGTGAFVSGSGLSYRPQGNQSAQVLTWGINTGQNIGGSYLASNGNTNIAGWFSATVDKNSAANIGIASFAVNNGTSPTQVAGYFALAEYGTSLPTFTNAAIVADNGATTSPIFIGRDNGSTVFTIADGGNVGIGNTPTAALDVKASTTTAAAMRFRSGTAPTSPNDGDIWFDGTDIKMRIGGVTKTFTLI